MLGFGLGATALAVAQGVTATNRGGTGFQGLYFDGQFWRFRNYNGGPAGTALGILRPPMPEPITPAEDGSTWTYCSGPADAYTCIDKININGTILTKSEAVYVLP